jgi:hypothetical protein
MTISATVLADSIGEYSPQLTSLQLRYPKFIHGEFMTHRVLSRNISSSEAISVDHLIRDVIEDPVYPSFWGKNEPGMSAKEEHHEWIEFSSGLGIIHKETKYEAWDIARRQAIAMAEAFNKAGYHKRIVNRLLEPFCHINVVVTATNWSNFFALCNHPDTQPVELRMLATSIKLAMDFSKPKTVEPGMWHLPYVRDEERIPWGIELSVARCARVSYLTHEQKVPSVEQDLALYQKLVKSVPLHASPCEHQATPDIRGDDYHLWRRGNLHGNFEGWVQFRKTLQGENQ